MSKPVLLVVCRNLPPVHGGMERLNHILLSGLAEQYKVFVLSPVGSRSNGHDNVDYLQCYSPNVFVFLLCATVRGLFARIQSTGRVSAVIATSGVVAPVARVLSVRFKVRLITFVHGLDLIADSAIYRCLFVPVIVRSELIIANSANTKALATRAGANVKAVHVINPCIEHGFVQCSRRALKNRDPVILSVGRLVERKGILQFVQKILPGLVKVFPNIKLMIVGEAPSKSIRREYGIREDIDVAVKTLGLIDYVEWCGSVSDERLTKIYENADVFIFPLIPVPGDVEGFGIVALEAASYGVPTVAFNEGGVSDAIENGTTGYLVQSGNYVEFGKVVANVLWNKDALPCEGFRPFLEGFSKENYRENVNKYIYEEINT